MWSRCFVSPTISYLLLHSKTVITAYSPLCPLLSILCNAILLNALQIGDCYRDFPLRPACFRNPLVSRSRQVMTFLFWGGSMVFHQCFRLGDGNNFYRSRFSRLLLGRWRKEACLHSRVLRRRVVLFVTVVRCFLSLFDVSSVVAWCLHAPIGYAWCLLNWCLWQYLRSVMSLCNYLLHLMSVQLISLTSSTYRHYFKESTK